MSRKQFYNDLTARLKEIVSANVPVFKTIDVWNRQLDPDWSGDAIKFPAVFIEYLPCTWQSMGRKIQQCDNFGARLHIVTQTVARSKDGSLSKDKAMEHFDIIDEVYKKLHGWGGDRTYFSSLDRSGSFTDHYNNGVRDDIEEYHCVLKDDTAMPVTTRIGVTVNIMKQTGG